MQETIPARYRFYGRCLISYTTRDSYTKSLQNHYNPLTILNSVCLTDNTYVSPFIVIPYCAYIYCLLHVNTFLVSYYVRCFFFFSNCYNLTITTAAVKFQTYLLWTG